MINKIFFILLIFLSVCTHIQAHQSALSYLRIKENSDKSIEMILKKPLIDINSDDIKIKLPKNCYDTITKSTQDSRGFLIFQRRLYCGTNGLNNGTIWIENLLETDKGVIFYFKSKNLEISNRLLTASNPFVSIKKQTDKNSSISYFKLGVEHILAGVDHLLFVLALLLLVSNFKILILTITSFTIAHSISLALAIFGYLNLPVLFIEALIALSIVFVAREVILKKEKKTLSQKYPYIISFIFGLLHGLGFANALFEIGIPHENIVLSLIFFNLGVEAGQLVFIATIIASAYLFNKITKHKNKKIRLGVSYMIGIISTFWFIQRILLLL